MLVFILPVLEWRLGWWKFCWSINVQNVIINLLFNVLLCLYLQQYLLANEQETTEEYYHDMTVDSVVIDNAIAQGNIGLSDDLEIGESLTIQAETPKKKEDPSEWRHQAANNPPISRPHDNEQWIMNNELWTMNY